MRFVKIIFLAVMLVPTLGVAKEDKKDEILCTCAVFEQKGDDTITGEPLLTKDIHIQAECDDNGANNCGLLCKALGQAGAAKESQDLCEVVQDTPKPLRPTIYSKVCDTKVWSYAGLTASKDYCCVQGKHDICQSATE